MAPQGDMPGWVACNEKCRSRICACFCVRIHLRLNLSLLRCGKPSPQRSRWNTEDLLLLLLLLADGEQFYFEDQGVAGADVGASAAVSVG